MFQKYLSLTITLLFLSFWAYAQQATITGIVKDEQGHPLDQVTVAVVASSIATATNASGYYNLQVPAGKNITVVFNFVGYTPQGKRVNLNAGENRTWDIVLKQKENTLGEVTIKDQRKREEAGSTYIDVAKLNIAPSTVGGVEGLIKTIVGSNNELTSQYSVRGGNYDENLVYVNDFEIYRPFLVRAGQQEGLSFVNPDLVSTVNFSVGGFQAKYGDKMSSVLDVSYKRPTEFAGSITASLLGAALHLEGASKNKKLTYLIGARQKSNQYLLQSQPTKGIYNPSFTDVQALVNYRFNDKWEIEAIGNYARNRFTFIPESQTTTFGVINQAYQLQVFYDGAELD
ncbi:MAG: carboxypeptidase-like regulatory domain-containing protein, partial [Flavipsychrobacter sp.]